MLTEHLKGHLEFIYSTGHGMVAWGKGDALIIVDTGIGKAIKLLDGEVYQGKKAKRCRKGGVVEQYHLNKVNLTITLIIKA